MDRDRTFILLPRGCGSSGNIIVFVRIAMESMLIVGEFSNFYGESKVSYLYFCIIYLKLAIIAGIPAARVSFENYRVI